MKKHVFIIIILLIIGIIVFKSFLPIRTPAVIATREIELRTIYQKIAAFAEKNEGKLPDRTTIKKLIDNTSHDAKLYEVNKDLGSSSISPKNEAWLIREKTFSHRAGRKRYLYKTRLVLKVNGDITWEKKLSFSLKEFLLNKSLF